jgi:hypothetical protein
MLPAMETEMKKPKAIKVTLAADAAYKRIVTRLEEGLIRWRGKSINQERAFEALFLWLDNLPSKDFRVIVDRIREFEKTLEPEPANQEHLTGKRKAKRLGGGFEPGDGTEPNPGRRKRPAE